MKYITALDAPPRYQFEPNSGSLAASQTNNCGPTCVTRIACYYNDTYYWIETTRRLVANCCVPTTAGQQAAMLFKRGVVARVAWFDTITQLNETVGWGDRPIIAGLQMSRVPALVRDHDFLGWHAITILSRAVLMDGTKGYWVNDPNFSPPGGHRPDPDDGLKFYSEQVMAYAFLANAPRWAVVPLWRKKVEQPVNEDLPVRFKSPATPSWIRIKGRIDVQAEAKFSSPTVVTTGPTGAGPYPLVGFTEGERYLTGANTSSNVWALYRINTGLKQAPPDEFKGRFGYVPRISTVISPA